MSNICYEETNFSIYGVILQKAINRVLSKIGVSDKGIKWVIFNEKPYMKNSVLPSFFRELAGFLFLCFGEGR